MQISCSTTENHRQRMITLSHWSNNIGSYSLILEVNLRLSHGEEDIILHFLNSLCAHVALMHLLID